MTENGGRARREGSDVKQRPWFLPVAVLAVSVLTVVELVDGVRERGDLTAYDPVVTADAVLSRNPVLTPVAEFFTFVGSTMSVSVMALALVAWIAWRHRDWLRAGFIGGGMALAAAVTFGLKELVGRGRPPAIMVVGPIDPDFAFPSGHTLYSTVFFGLVAGLVLVRMQSPVRRWAVGAAWLVASLAVGWSRVYLGYHWLTDVLAGFAVAVGVLATVALLWHVASRRVLAVGSPVSLAT